MSAILKSIWLLKNSFSSYFPVQFYIFSVIVIGITSITEFNAAFWSTFILFSFMILLPCKRQQQ